LKQRFAEGREALFPNGAPQFLFYRRRGLYAEQLIRYFERFDQSKMRIYLHEDLDRDAVSITQDVFRFLEVDDSLRLMLVKDIIPLSLNKGICRRIAVGNQKRAMKRGDDGAPQTDMGIGSIRPGANRKAN